MVRPSAGTRRQRERERHRQEILEAAERVFVERGYEAATVEQIAREAQFAVGTLYLFFKGKEDLYRSVIERIVEDFREEFERKVLREKDPERALDELIRLRLEHFEAHRGFFRVLVANRFSAVGVKPPRLRRLHRWYLQQVAELLARGMKQGVFEKGDPQLLAVMLDGALHGLVMYWSEYPPQEPLEERIRMIQEWFLRLRRRSRKERLPA